MVPKSTLPAEYVVRPVTDVRRWCELVAEAARLVATGRLDKVVLARELAVVADRTIAVAEVARRLVAAYPSCMVFAVDGFVGASPELLVAREGDGVWSHPLAGTAPRNGPDSEVQQATWSLSSAKERHEHRLVVDAVSGAGPCSTGRWNAAAPTSAGSRTTRSGPGRSSKLSA